MRLLYRNFTQKDKCRNGFTLVELMIVIAIIATLVAIAVPLYSSYIDRTRIAVAKVQIRDLERQITIYLINNKKFPATLEDLGVGTVTDPWHNSYRYLPVEGTQRGLLRKDHSMVPVNQDYDLYSMGKDGKSQPPFTAKNSQDDVVRANDGAYVGLVSLY